MTAPLAEAPLQLFVGQGNGNALFKAFDGPDDDGAAFYPLAETAAVAPAGSSGECIFTTIFLAVTRSMGVTLRVTPILDGRRYDGTDGTSDERKQLVLAPSSERTTTAHEVPLSLPLYDPVDLVTEVARLNMRGQRLALLVEATTPLTDGDLFFEDAVVEYEVVFPSLPVATA